eukprot:gene34587-42665_t
MYTGAWMDDAMCGLGNKQYGNGNVYIGEWFNNQRCGEGEGVRKYANGTKYVGGWMGGERVFTSACGDVSRGVWVPFPTPLGDNNNSDVGMLHGHVTNGIYRALVDSEPSYNIQIQVQNNSNGGGHKEGCYT